MRTFARKHIALVAAVAPLSMTACASSSVDEVLIHRDALNVQKHLSADSKSRQVSYHVNLNYPATALTNVQFTKLKRLGWLKCSGYREGWESYVDASKGEGREQSVFQNISYWSKGSTLLTVLMRYDTGVAKDKRPLAAPDNTQQNVILIKDSNPGTKEWLKITCP